MAANANRDASFPDGLFTVGSLQVFHDEKYTEDCCYCQPNKNSTTTKFLQCLAEHSKIT